MKPPVPVIPAPVWRNFKELQEWELLHKTRPEGDKHSSAFESLTEGIHGFPGGFLVTTTADERGRETVYRCFNGAGLPWIAPVGRLDKASEGLLLFSNDPQWAARITDPATGPAKTYHVQVATRPEAALLSRLVAGIAIDGEHLAATSAQLLRTGEKNSWLEIVLAEGRNRHIRRLLQAHDIPVLRLIRVAIGGLSLGSLAKGQWRRLEAGDLARLCMATGETG